MRHAETQDCSNVGVLKVNIQEFQNMMRRIYFHRDFERGAMGTFNWLADEVKELEEAIQLKDKKAMENEFADILAWLASLANVVGVELEEAALSKYDGRCPKCHNSPCKCTTFQKDP